MNFETSGASLKPIINQNREHFIYVANPLMQILKLENLKQRYGNSESRYGYRNFVPKCVKENLGYWNFEFKYGNRNLEVKKER